MIPRFDDGRDWFFERRFGLFIHWGLYAIPAWHEQRLYRLGLTRGECAKLIHEFNPVRFDCADPKAVIVHSTPRSTVRRRSEQLS